MGSEPRPDGPDPTPPVASCQIVMSHAKRRSFVGEACADMSSRQPYISRLLMISTLIRRAVVLLLVEG